MRIVHVISSLKRGGAETVLASILTHSLCDSSEHHVIYFHDGPLKNVLHKNNIQLHHITYGPLFLFRFFYRVSKIDPDGIHALLWFAIVSASLVGFFLRIPVMAVFHNNIDQNSRYKNVVDWVMLRAVTEYAAVSESVARSVTQFHTWLNSSHITIIHNGIDMPTYDYQTTRERLRILYNISPETVVIGSVGRFEAVKRYTWLLDCFAIIRATSDKSVLFLVGTGSQEHLLRAYAAYKGIAQNVQFIVNQDAYMLYPSFDIFTLTSEKEGISIALLEAMSYGRACLITNNEHSHSVVTNGCDGYLVLAHDQKSFCKKLCALVENPVLRERVGRGACKTTSDRFSRDVMVQKYIISFRQLCKKTIF